MKSAEILPWAQKFVAVSHGPERPIRRVLHLVPVGPERVNEADFAEALSWGANGAGSRLSWAEAEFFCGTNKTWEAATSFIRRGTGSVRFIKLGFPLLRHNALVFFENGFKLSLFLRSSAVELFEGIEVDIVPVPLLVASPLLSPRQLEGPTAQRSCAVCWAWECIMRNWSSHAMGVHIWVSTPSWQQDSVCVCVSHSGQDWEEVNISTNSHFSHLSLDALPKKLPFSCQQYRCLCSAETLPRSERQSVAVRFFVDVRPYNETRVWRQTQHTTEQIEAWTTAWAPWW